MSKLHWQMSFQSWQTFRPASIKRMFISGLPHQAESCCRKVNVRIQVLPYCRAGPQPEHFNQERRYSAPASMVGLRKTTLEVV